LRQIKGPPSPGRGRIKLLITPPPVPVRSQTPAFRTSDKITVEKNTDKTKQRLILDAEIFMMVKRMPALAADKKPLAGAGRHKPAHVV
jgi:hypothetical protein